MLAKKLTAEFLGTMWLVFGGCGSAVLAANFGGDGNPLGIGFVGVALAFGLTVLSGAYAFGHISGGHFNPAVSVGLAVGNRFPMRELAPYIGAQVLGGLFGAFLLYMIATGTGSFHIDPTSAGAFATNGFGDFSPGKYSMMSAFITEVVLTAIFLIIIMGSTHEKAPTGFAPIAIGLGLTLIHLISIPVTNTSVNPARSTAVAVFVGGTPLAQVWLFWVAPIIGAVIGGALYRWLGEDRPDITGKPV